jgi:small ligand-binding sensory domain FIST
MLLVADPFTFPVEVLLDGLGRVQPGLAVVGGMASAANAPGGNRLLVNDPCYTAGRSGRCSPRMSPRKPSCHRAAGRSAALTS